LTRMIKIQWWVLLCVAIGATACSRSEPPSPQAKSVYTVAVQFQSGSESSSYTGDVRARFDSALGFRVPGKIIDRMVYVGAQVKRGQVLARLDPADMRLSAESAQSQLQAARSDFNQSKADLERFRELRDKQFISEAEFERRQTAYDVARAGFEQAQAQLSMSRNQTGYATLVADHEGVITALVAEVGQVVAAGQPVMRLARAGEKEVEIPVPESRLQELRAATQVTVSLWANPKASYKGEIREIAPSADSVTRTYAVRVTILEPDAQVQFGMTANVHLGNVATARTALLPPTAVFGKGDSPSVWVVDGTSSQVRSTAVTVAEYRQDAVVVTAGLQEGQQVVRAGVHKLFEGEKVRVLAAPGK